MPLPSINQSIKRQELFHEKMYGLQSTGI